MSAISTYLEYIRSKIYAKDVRTAIVNAISQCYDDVNKPALQTEAMQAAVQAKIDAGQMAALTIADGSLTGAKLANGTIQTAKIADGAVTAGKLASGAIPTDTTLSQSGIPADAKAAGDEIDDLREEIQDIEPFSEDAKTALLNCFAHVAWTDEHGQDYVDALENALYTETGLVSISAVFNSGSNVIYDTTPLNGLKAYLTVTGHYNDGTSKAIKNYTLSGTLTVGTSVVTVSAEGKTTTFSVVVEEYWTYEWTYADGLPNQNGMELDQNGSANTIAMTNEGLRVQVEDVSERRVRYRHTSLPADVRYTSADIELEFKIVQYGSYNQAPYGNGVRMYAGMGDQTNWGTPKGLEITCNTSGTIYLKTNVTNWSMLDDTVQFATNTWYKVRIHQTLTQADVYVDDTLVGSVPVANIKENVANPQFMATRCSNVLFRAFRFRVFQ